MQNRWSRSRRVRSPAKVEKQTGRYPAMSLTAVVTDGLREGPGLG